MQYIHLGRSGMKVSRLCLGTMNFGPETSEADSFLIMDRALELGINFFDTANVYGWRGRGGDRTHHRPVVCPGRESTGASVLATKVFGRMGDWPNQSKLSALHIKRRAKTAFAGCGRTISICIRCTTSIANHRGRKSGRRWNNSIARGRSYMSEAVICRMAYRPSTGSGEIAPFHGTVSEQSWCRT